MVAKHLHPGYEFPLCPIRCHFSLSMKPQGQALTGSCYSFLYCRDALTSVCSLLSEG